MYITMADYANTYKVFDDKLFNRLSAEASRYLDKYTTGVDGVKKLRIAFPVDEYDSCAVKTCAAAVINLLYRMHKAEEETAKNRGYESTENGLRGKVISSISSGSESISYSTSTQESSVIEKAVADPSLKKQLIRDVIKDGLQGITDANGVNLLYMGAYPRRLV